jgi:hypothetical protein
MKASNQAVNEGLTPRIYREYCWFAVLLLVVAIGLVSRPPLAQAPSGASSISAPAVDPTR